MNNEDLRWYNQTEKRTCTYIETLAAELKHGNRLITGGKWLKIEKMLPTITEEAAKEQCFEIRDTIRAEVRYHQTLYG